jgi:hypothetical protein
MQPRLGRYEAECGQRSKRRRQPKAEPVLSAINIAGPCPPEAKPKREWAPLQASPICTCHVCVATETVREARKKCELGPPL